MKMNIASACAILIAAAVSLCTTPVMAETQSNIANDWLGGAEIAPPFTVPDSKSAWETRRHDVRRQLGQLLGKLPPRPILPTVRILSREDKGDYILEKFSFDNEAGATVPGYLFLPKGPQAPRPAILYCHWHGGEYAIGKEELFQARHTPEPPGPTLAKRGFVVLGIDAYCFGERNGMGPGGPTEKDGAGEMSASKFNLWVGRTLWGMMLRDELMALDYLVRRPEVDANRLGVMGMSMGATRSWWLMALDERLKTGVAIACLTRYEDLIRHQELKAHGIYYFVPNLLNHFDTEAIIALLAPRPVLLMNGDEDWGSPVDGIHKIEAAVRPAYRLYGKEDGFVSIVYPKQGHVYTPEMWNKTLKWLDEKLVK